jgi:hypothetical protein
VITWWGKHGRVPVPVGAPCRHCQTTIVDTDRGVMMPEIDEYGRAAPPRPWHLRCLLEHVLGPRAAAREPPEEALS